MATRVVILGAAGRDFHNFNVVYRDDPATAVVAFTAAQIPGLAGDLERLVREGVVDRVLFAYSDVSRSPGDDRRRAVRSRPRRRADREEILTGL